MNANDAAKLINPQTNPKLTLASRLYIKKIAPPDNKSILNTNAI